MCFFLGPSCSNFSTLSKREKVPNILVLLHLSHRCSVWKTPECQSEWWSRWGRDGSEHPRWRKQREICFENFLFFVQFLETNSLKNSVRLLEIRPEQLTSADVEGEQVQLNTASAIYQIYNPTCFFSIVLWIRESPLLLITTSYCTTVYSSYFLFNFVLNPFFHVFFNYRFIIYNAHYYYYFYCYSCFLIIILLLLLLVVVAVVIAGLIIFILLN